MPTDKQIALAKQQQELQRETFGTLEDWGAQSVIMADRLKVDRKRWEDATGVPHIDKHVITYVEPDSKRASSRTFYGFNKASSFVDDLGKLGVEDVKWDSSVIPRDKKYLSRRIEEFKSMLHTHVPFRKPDFLVFD